MGGGGGRGLSVGYFSLLKFRRADEKGEWARPLAFRINLFYCETRAGVGVVARFLMFGQKLMGILVMRVVVFSFFFCFCEMNEVDRYFAFRCFFCIGEIS